MAVTVTDNNEQYRVLMRNSGSASNRSCIRPIELRLRSLWHPGWGWWSCVGTVCAIATVPASIEYIKAGTLRALAVTTTTLSELLPDLPTVGDFVPGYANLLAG